MSSTGIDQNFNIMYYILILYFRAHLHIPVSLKSKAVLSFERDAIGWDKWKWRHLAIKLVTLF